MQEGQAHSQSQASSLRHTLSLHSPREGHPGQAVPGKALRVERRRRRQPCPRAVQCLSGLCPYVCRGFALLGRQNSFCVASSGTEGQQRGGQASPAGCRTAAPTRSTRAAHGSVGSEVWPVLGAIQRCSVGATATLCSCPCVQRAVPARCPQCPLWCTWIRCTQQAECSAASPVVEVSCGALPCPCHCLRGVWPRLASYKLCSLY